MFTRVAIATDNAGQGPIVTARDELRFCRATFFGHETREFAHYFHYYFGFCKWINPKLDTFIDFGHESPAIARHGHRRRQPWRGENDIWRYSTACREWSGRGDLSLAATQLWAQIRPGRHFSAPTAPCRHAVHVFIKGRYRVGLAVILLVRTASAAFPTMVT